MRIKKTESWELDGKFYPTEQKAVEAALQGLGTRLIQKHSACMAIGLIESADELVELLQAHKRLAQAEEKPDSWPGHHASCRGRATGFVTDCDCQ